MNNLALLKAMFYIGFRWGQESEMLPMWSDTMYASDAWKNFMSGEWLKCTELPKGFSKATIDAILNQEN